MNLFMLFTKLSFLFSISRNHAIDFCACTLGLKGFKPWYFLGFIQPLPFPVG